MTRSGELELPPGFRFHPTDEELVNHYLIKKCASLPISVPIIKEIDLYKFDPWDLPQRALYGEKEWYFFSPRDRKYPNGSRPNRAAGTGYWKATGADKAIGRPKALGIKKALVFYAGKAPRGVKTNWIMHEYRLANVDRSAKKNNTSRLDDWVLCRIYNKKGHIEKNHPTAVAAVEDHESFEIEDEKPNIIAVADHAHPSPTTTSDSSSSEHVLSPEVTWQSERNSFLWNNSNNKNEDGRSLEDPFDFNLGFTEDPFGTQVEFQMDQLSSFQDIFSFLQTQF